MKSEDILMQINANHQHLILSFGGKLILTKTFLKFKPHAFNIGAKEITINLKDIDDISTTHIIGPALIKYG